MTTVKTPYSEAIQSSSRNRYAVWSYPQGAYAAGPLQPNPDHATSRIRAGLAEIHARPVAPPDNRRVFTMGSCFAREIENALIFRGVEVPCADFTPYVARLDLFPHAGPTIPLRQFFNRYNLPSMLQELKVLANGFPADPNWLLYRSGAEFSDLHYHMVLSRLPFDACQERRAIVQQTLSAAMRRANIFVVTLGLCEAWFDLESKSYLNVIPPRQVATDNPGRFELHLIDYDDNVRCLLRIHDLLESVLGREQFLLIVTVSPQPMIRTFTPEDVVVANTGAKSVLRAAAGEAARRRSNIVYFPAYEIALNSNPSLVWQADGQHLERSATVHVVKTFSDWLTAGPLRQASASGQESTVVSGATRRPRLPQRQPS
ncbi:MAG TPA: GSCFA domain-containing protein [Caulobacteraceae bacterium]|nr:GSCFA domain-containing protein [Caulobacteraceae bacterium]